MKNAWNYALATAILLACSFRTVADEKLLEVRSAPKEIKAYDIDYNWGPGGVNGFAKPGLWADADPAKHIGMIGPQTRRITCLANWNGQDPIQIVPAALNDRIGLYGFTKPGDDSLLPLKTLLAKPLNELKGDEKNIAALARAFHGASMTSVWTSDRQFVERQK
jgi:hypothetical protein